LEFWENRTRVDAIAAWLNQCVIADPMAKTPIGSDRFEGEDGSTVTTLFGSYNRYCHKAGSKPKNHNNFSPDLLELCRSVLGWSVEKESTNTGKFIRGLRLRVAGIDDLIPTHDYTLAENLIKGDGTGDGTGDGSELILHKGFPDGDGSLINQLEKQAEIFFEPEFQIDNSLLEENLLPLQSVENDLVKNKSGLGFEPSPSLNVSPHNGFEPSPQPSPQPSPSITTRQPVRGDRVRLLSGGEEYKISWVSCGSDKVVLVSARTGEPLTAASKLRRGAAAGGLNLIDVSELEFLDT
jgi:putative DNA primase/helicase